METTEERTGRASPMTPDDRRAAIIDAVAPLVMEHGRAITSREIAEAAGVAEGTVFRAFGDKDTLIDAVIEKLLDPEPFRDAMRGVDPAEPLERKMADIIRLLQGRFAGVMGVMRAIGREGGTPPAPTKFVERVVHVLEPDLDRLAVPAEDVAHLLRLVAFASAIRPLNQEREFTVDELAAFVSRGIAARPLPEN